jgi:hypothetical protein
MNDCIATFLGFPRAKGILSLTKNLPGGPSWSGKRRRKNSGGQCRGGEALAAFWRTGRGGPVREKEQTQNFSFTSSLFEPLHLRGVYDGFQYLQRKKQGEHLIFSKKFTWQHMSLWMQSLWLQLSVENRKILCFSF